MDVRNAVAVVTGAASGLGAATALELANRGAQVFGLDLRSQVEVLDPVDGVTYLAADVTNYEEVEVAVAVANDSGPLRVAVSCAGIAPGVRLLSRGAVHDPQLFSRVIDVNLRGTFHVLAAAAKFMSDTEPLEHGQRGVIVNTASIAAFEGQVGQVAYAASKAGVVGLGLPAARDLAQHGIRVNTVAPGIVETPMMAAISQDYRASLAANVPFPSRLARPTEFAQLVAFIVDHDYMNGEVVRMDGALRMAPR